MNILQRILDYSYHARDKRALDPETGEPIPYAKEPSIAVKVGAAMVNSSWAKRNLLKQKALDQQDEKELEDVLQARHRSS